MIQMIKDSREMRLGIYLLVFLLFFAIFAKQIAPYDYTELFDATLAPPSTQHLFGTDDLGRDVFSLVVQGAQTSLLIGVIAAFISTAIGVLLGALAGYYGGWFDRMLSEIMSVFMMTPSFFLIIIVVALYGSSLKNIILVIALTSWTGTARLMRSQVVALKERTFIKALITLGEANHRILLYHILPNGIQPIITHATTSISSAILYESSLSFIGLGDPTRPSWGRIIYMGKPYLFRAWWVSLFGGLFLVITVYAFHLLAEGLNQWNASYRKG